VKIINTMETKTKKPEGVLSKVILVFAIFAVGFFSALALNSYLSNSLESPFSYSSNSEVKAPSDFIKESQISITKDKIIINVEDASLSAYAPTGSMVPLFDKGANGIRIVPQSEDEINAGDIVTYNKDSMLIVHRVIEKGIDTEGTYFITKGDNNDYADEKVRFSDIKYKTIGILY
jgi:hypothetical protein